MPWMPGPDATQGDDIFTGTDLADAADGLGGNDTLNGGDGDDDLTGGEGDDTIDGGEGEDTMSGGAGNDIYVADTIFDRVSEAADGGDDEVRVVANAFRSDGGVERILGLGVDDLRLVGDDGANEIVGSDGFEGDDAFFGANRLEGGGGDDTLIGSVRGPNVLDGGAGADTMTGGGKEDEFVVDDPGDVVNDPGDDPATAEDDDVVVARLAAYTLGDGIENLSGSLLSQTLTGNAGNNVIGGEDSSRADNGGVDNLFGLAGDDRLIATPSVVGATLDGGEGDDTLVPTYGPAGGVNFNEVQDLTGATLVSFERLSFVDLTPSGSTTATFLGSQIGAGLAPDLTIFREQSLGGVGGVTLVFRLDTAALDLSGFAFAAPSDGGFGLPPSGGWTDADRISIIGSAEADTVVGSSRRDTLQGGAGNDTLDGRADIDIADYSDALDAVQVILDGDNPVTVTQSGQPTDTLIAIEGVTGGAANDALFGDARANVLSGGGGEDLVEGGEGDDTLSGGDAADRVGGGGGNDSLQGGQGLDRLFGGGGDDVLRGATGAASDTEGDILEGDAGADRLFGGRGDDWLVGGEGDDRLDPGRDGGVNVLDGGEGDDLLDLGSRFDGAWVDLADGHFSAPDTWATLIDVEGLSGTRDSDALYGSESGDRLFGEREDDVLFGRGGDDLLQGDTPGSFDQNDRGNDYLDGGDGDDRLTGGLGVDRLIGGDGADLFDLGRRAGWDVAQDFDGVEGDRIDLGGLRFQYMVERDADGDGDLDTQLTYVGAPFSGEGGTFVALGVTGLTLDVWNAFVV